MKNGRGKGRQRLVWVALGMFALLAVLVVQFYRIQILEGERWSRVALRQHVRIVSEPFVRGAFFSNTSVKRGHPEAPQPFVIDILKFHLHADNESIPISTNGFFTSKICPGSNFKNFDISLFTYLISSSMR